MLKSVCIIIILFAALSGSTQTLGGNAAYNFLKLPSSPLLAAAGGVNISYATADIGLTASNPALLRQTVDRQLQTSFNAFLAGTKAYNLTGAFYAEKIETFFGTHLSYLDYGNLSANDAAGNSLGQFRPVDFTVQFSASRTYLKHWNYGLTLKYIQSAYGQYRSNAIATDIGVLYHDSAANFSAALVAKNMGRQLTAYSAELEELPFDLQVGFTKRLPKAPFGFSLTAHHLQRFDILHNDTTFNRDNNLISTSSTLNNLLAHFVVATHIYAGKNLEATVGYNVLQRQELSSGAAGNGLAGFSAGLRLTLNKLQVLYARSSYQRGIAANQIGLTLHMDKLFGIGH